MNTPAPKENSTSSKSSQPSFNKNGGSSFLSSSNEVEQLFFLPTPGIQKSPTSSFFSGGNNAAQAPFLSANTLIQTKLSINDPGDKYEQEADAMADKVMRMTSVPPGGADAMPQSGYSTVPALQRKCAACGKEDMAQRQEMEEEEPVQTKLLMRKAEGGGYTASPQLQSQLNSSKGGGNPLPGRTLSSMNQAFGTDFSHVRIHTDSGAAEMSQGIQAKAFTHERDIYFNRGQYSPESGEGKRLLGHELTHVVQQGKNIIQRQPVGTAMPAPGALLAATHAERLLTQTNPAIWFDSWGNDLRDNNSNGKIDDATEQNKNDGEHYYKPDKAKICNNGETKKTYPTSDTDYIDSCSVSNHEEVSVKYKACIHIPIESYNASSVSSMSHADFIPTFFGELRKKPQWIVKHNPKPIPDPLLPGDIVASEKGADGSRQHAGIVSNNSAEVIHLPGPTSLRKINQFKPSGKNDMRKDPFAILFSNWVLGALDWFARLKS